MHNKPQAGGHFTGRDKNESKLDELYADVFQLKDGWIIGRRSYFFRKGV